MGSLSDFKVAEGLVVGGSDIHLNHGTNAGVISVDTVVTGNTAGKSLTFKSGPSAGNVAGGIIDFQTTDAGSAGGGSNSGSYASRLSISGAGVVSIPSLVATSVDINAGTIDGVTMATSDITVGAGKTLDVSAGTLTLANDQISGDKVSGGTIGTTTITALAGNLDMGGNNITDVDVLSVDRIGVVDGAVGLSLDFSNVNTTKGTIKLKDNLADALNILEDTNSYMKFTTTNGSEQIVFGENSTFAGTTIANLGTVSAATSITSTAFVGPIDGVVGGNTPAAGTFGALQGTRLIATTDGRIGGTDIETNTLLQVNGVYVAQNGNLGGGGSAASRNTLKYGEVRIHSDIAESDMPNMHVENMGGAYIIDNEEPEETIGQGTIYTVGRGTETSADAWGIGRQSTTGKFAVGYIAKAYDGIADSSENPMRTAQSVFEITTAGNIILSKNDGQLSFTSNTNKLTSFMGHSSAVSTTYTWPQQAVAGRVLQTAGNGDLSWVEQSGGVSFSGSTANGLLTYGGTDTADVESTATYNGQTLHINTATDNTPAQLLLEHSYNDTVGGNMMFRLDKGAAGAANDVLGSIKWQGDDASQNLTDYALIKGDVVAATGGSEEGRLTVQLAQTSNGALADVMILTGGDETDGTSSKVLIKGDLQVDGDTTTINTAQLTVEDDVITVSKGNDTLTNASGSGIEIEATSASSVNWKYNHNVTGWQSNVDIDLGSTSESYKIAGVDVLTETQVLGKPLPGVVVGTTEAQELSNKTLQSPKIKSAGETWVTVLDTAEVGISNSSSESTIYQYDGAAYRTAKLLIQVTNIDPSNLELKREVHAAEMLVTYEGTNGPDGADLAGETANVYAVEYASVYTSAAALGTFDVYSNSTSNNTVDVKFNPATQDTYKIRVYATLMEDGD